ncbi:hypothetical protein CHS0354_009558 [Potamilus streckersoni]|uniref:RING-type E3 ubiquitin transferase n=1 Tax=Potamilus streckersoni TaxID=2493646 RepID=A0AAE0SPG5_9BIVA|nr:hypothetical protein CHS0354_009558 [Potamilus streckersoni]
MAEAMSTSDRSTSSQILCRYFLHGACRAGSSCLYSHDRRDRPDNVCRYFLRDSCVYGERCRYDHIKPSNSSSFGHRADSALRSSNLQMLANEHTPASNMVSLKKVLKGETTSSTPLPPEEWIQANEFVPGQPFVCSSVPFSYAKAAQAGTNSEYEATSTSVPVRDGNLLCPFSVVRECPYGDQCTYLHGEICDLCGFAVLHPTDKELQEKHRSECISHHEKEMELAFAIAQSKDKACGICLETIMDKEPSTERRFGILSHCNHCFCLTCIRQWRAAKQFENKTIRSCPECRVTSDFVTPSKYWVENTEEKVRLIEGYKRALSTKQCRYFKQGQGECPFNDKCFYLHAYPDGTKAIPQPRKPRHRQNANGDMDLLQQLILWDFLEERENRLLLFELEDELNDLIFNLSLGSSDVDDDDDYSDLGF